MNEKLILTLSQSRLFWWLRTVATRVFFWVWSEIFRAKNSLAKEKVNYNSLQSLFFITQRPLIFAIGIAATLQCADSYLLSYYAKLGINVPNDGDYVTFLAAVSSIGGVFIGLYYTGISAVGGAIYAVVPNNLRELLAYERRGNVYMRYLAFLTFLCLALISFRLTGLPRLYVAVPFIAILAGIGIFAFVKLGQEAFYFFDPTTLSGYIFEQLQRWIEVVKAGGYRWHDKSYQHHANKQSSIILDTLYTLSDYTASKPHLSGVSYINLTKNLLRFLVYYEYSKRKIPTDSAWYRQRYKHKDWYLTDCSQVSIAHLTGTTLNPEITVDKEWVEKQAIPIVKNCIELNLSNKRYDDIHALLDYVEAYLKFLANEGAVERAFKFLDEVALAVLEQFEQDPNGKIIKIDVLEKLAVAERLSSLPISIALGYRELVINLERASIEKKISLVRWHAVEDIYKKEFPIYCLERLEWFRPRLDFESKIEGKIITPIWYLTELVLQTECDTFSTNTKTLVSQGIAFYNGAITKAIGCKHPWLASSIMSREWEYWHKLENQMEIWPQKWLDLSDGRRIEDLPWSEFDICSLRSDSKQRQRELLKLMSQQSTLLALIKQPDGYPDYAGQFLHTSGEVAMDALFTNDGALLESVFGPYFAGCLLLIR